MKKFLSMFFMLSVLPTIGLAVDTTSTHNPYKPLEDYKNQANKYKQDEAPSLLYKELCEDLHEFTTTYNLKDGYKHSPRSYTQPIFYVEDCAKIYRKDLLPDKAAQYFLSQVKEVNGQIKQEQIDIVKEYCNIDDGISYYKEIEWDGGRTAVNKPTTECAATSGDNRCLLVQPLQQLPYKKSENYYSCNRPELEFGKFLDGSGYIGVKANKNTCGKMTQSDTTAGILDSRIKLTLKDFDEHCELKTDSRRGEILYKLSENQYPPDEEEARILEIVSKWQ